MLRILFYPIIFISIAVGVAEIGPALKWAVSNIGRYQYILYGMLAYALVTLIPFIRKNMEFIRTFSHESTHTLVGMLFLRKIHSFEAGEGSGEMSHSGGLRFGGMFISLSPYCFPVLTWLLFLLRELSAAKSIYIFDIMIGLVTLFYLVCFYQQTGNHQTDIRRHGLVRSYLFIAAIRILNLGIILEAVRRGLFAALKHLFTEYWNDICVGFNWVVDTISSFF